MPKIIKDVMIDRRTGAMTTRDIEVPDDATEEEAMQHILDDCPECRALMAGGEVPRIRRPSPFARPPRWRSRKRG